jgi:hypothetical protein
MKSAAGTGDIHEQTVSDRRPHRARHRAIVDRPGTGAIDWPRSSFMIRQIQWAGYGAALAALGLILIWQSKR